MAETDTERDGRDDRDDRESNTAFRRRSLGEIDPAGSRHMWTRSAVHAVGEVVITGQWDGTVTAFDADSLEPRWSVEHADHAVGITTIGEGGVRGENGDGNGGDTVVVAGRGETGPIAAYDLDDGSRRWRYGTAADVGEASRDSIFYLPYVVALETDDGEEDDGRGGRLYAAARRYERDGERRQWHSTILAFDANGEVRWCYETDASPIALDLCADGTRLAVGYNRCMGSHDNGVVVLDAETGTPAWTWDPGTEGDRRVGDVSFDGDTLAVASHGDKRGYLLDSGGAERWRVDLATETEVGEETLYAYPNHTHAHGGRVAFLTGNTYAVESRETESRHPNEHRIAVFDADGSRCWSDGVRGFVHGLASDGSDVVVPCAQNFRIRAPETHAVRRYDLNSGDLDIERFAGIAMAAAVAGPTVAAIEEPVRYHDEELTRGEYALHVGSVDHPPR